MRSVESGLRAVPPDSQLADAQAESRLVHIVWLTSGSGRDGNSVAMTSATSPSLELDREPEWRAPGPRLASGYKARW